MRVRNPNQGLPVEQIPIKIAITPIALDRDPKPHNIKVPKSLFDIDEEREWPSHFRAGYKGGQLLLFD
jgi:hypothetical protein